MKNTKIILTFLLALAACGRNTQNEQRSSDRSSYSEEKSVTENGTKNKELENESQDTVLAPPLSSTAAHQDAKDSAHQFIRTADIKFKVKNVISSTYEIEDITARHGGFVTYTNLGSEIDNVSLTALSEDSSLETTRYTVSNFITIRVPNTALDTTLKEMAKLVSFMDHRIIKADDVSFQFLLNDLNRKKLDANKQRLMKDIDSRGKKLHETMDGEDDVFNKQGQIDDSKLNDLSLQEQVKYSTITLAVYQRPSIKKEMVANDKNINAYEPGLGSRITAAFQSGWNVLKMLLVFLVRIWWLIALSLAGWLVFKKFIRFGKIQ